VSDVCVLSSSSEGFSNSILEYMAARRPVVATDVGGVREAVEDGETGYLVGPGDDSSMAACIVYLLRDPEQARAMGERARAIVEHRFSSQSRLAQTELLYGSLMMAAGPRARRQVKTSKTVLSGEEPR
jgi:glycosyltransferase involved in cell wall biosynthesis